MKKVTYQYRYEPFQEDALVVEETAAIHLMEQLMLDFPEKARYFFLTQQEGYDCK